MHQHNRRRFDYPRRLLPNAHLASLETGVETLDQARPRTHYSIGYPAWNLLYYVAFSSLRWQRPNVLVETGANWGCSTIVLAQALAHSGYDGHVYSVDISPENLQRAAENVAAAGLSPFVTLIESDSVEFLRHHPYGAPEPVTLAFLDGNHHKDHLLAEFEALYPRLDDESLVYFDNTAPNPYTAEPRVHEALIELESRWGGNLIEFPNCSWDPNGQAIWQRRGRPQPNR